MTKAAFFLAFGFAASAYAADPAVHVSGAGLTAHDWSVDELRTKLATSVRSVDFETHGHKHTGVAVPLLGVLKASGLDPTLKMDPKPDPKTKNLPLRMTVLVTGTDGYASALSLGELLPDIGNHPAWLVLEEDGSPLPARSAPVELVVPDDGKPGRWVRGVASVELISPAAEAAK